MAPHTKSKMVQDEPQDGTSGGGGHRRQRESLLFKRRTKEFPLSIAPAAISLKSANRVFPIDSSSFLWFALLFCCAAVAQCAAAISYVAPDDCEWSFVNDSSTDVSLTCRLQNVRSPPAGTGSSNSDATNFSLIQPLHTASLSIQCEPVLFQSRLSNGSLAHLRHLKALTFQHCKFADVPDGAFDGLSELRNLTLRTYNHEWQEGLSLQLGALSLSRLSHMERLDLSSNNIFQLPEFLFCGLSKLKLLNLSRNSVLDGGLVGLNGVDERKGGRPCLQELRRLDLSANMIKHLKRGEFVRLHNLQALFLQKNDLAEVSEAALEGLRRLQVLDLSGNRLPELPTHFFHSTPDVRDLYLQNNSLTTLPSGVFRGLQQLLVMNLSRNDISSDSVSSELFADLIRLVILDLSRNRISYINATTFQSQYSLQMLYLSHNRISSIADNAFAPLYNLHTLDMSANLLKHLDVYTFNGLYVLNYLSLERNVLETIHSEAFRNCSSVKSLLLADNKLTSSPSALSSLQFLRELDVSGNQITKLSNSSFAGLKQLQKLDVSENQIGNLSRGTFRDLPVLKRLDLSRNTIQGLEHGLFDDAPELVSIDVRENILTDINGLFMNLRSLETLNVSANKITWFDYALIPTELRQLDLHDNAVETLGNYFELEAVLQLRWLDASNNQLVEINPVSFPNRIESILVRGNKIKIVHPFAFMSKSNLTEVDLRDNKLRNVDMNSFRLKTWSLAYPLPRFLVSGNPFFCDCTMEWLQRINDLLDDTRQYPRIGDLEMTECRLPFARSRPVVPLASANSSDFLCRYKSHCFALCHCCDFDACDCEMVCPENCTCYYDQTWNTNIVDCSSRQFSIMPHPVPMDVTHLFLDGNYLPQLTSHAFIGRKNMQVLFLNNSNIVNINNRTFNGLQGIKVLHLEHNQLTVLHGFEFENLSLLQEVYLSYNKIHSLSNISFVSLRSLKILHLDHNAITHFQIWNLNSNTLLSDLRLGANPWSCHCGFMEEFQEWVQSYGTTSVMDSENIRCYYRDAGGTTHELLEKNAGPYLLTFSSSTCSNNTAGVLGGASGGMRGGGGPGANGGQNSGVKYFPAVFNEDLVPVVIVAPCLLVIVILASVLLCVYRKQLKVWLYSKYGVRLFRKHHRYSPDSEKLFDAFVSYCKKDEAFVAQMLAPELEECGYPSRGVPGGPMGGNASGGLPSFRLCLRYRDLPVASYVAEAIQEAIECSHRTLFVLSEQFLRSEWCRFELKTAHHEAQTNRKHRLVAVVLDKISFKDLDPDARLCLRSSTIIHWGDRRFWEKLRYAMPEGREKSTATLHHHQQHQPLRQQNIRQQRHRDLIVGAGLTGGGVVSTHCAMMMDQSSNNVKLV